VSIQPVDRSSLDYLGMAATSSNVDRHEAIEVLRSHLSSSIEQQLHATSRARHRSLRSPVAISQSVGQPVSHSFSIESGAAALQRHQPCEAESSHRLSRRHSRCNQPALTRESHCQSSLFVDTLKARSKVRTNLEQRRQEVGFVELRSYVQCRVTLAAQCRDPIGVSGSLDPTTHQ